MAGKQELMTKGAYHAIRHRFRLSNGDMDAICGAMVLIPSVPLPEPEHSTVSIRPPQGGAEWLPGSDGLYIAKVMVKDDEPICAQAVNPDEDKAAVRGFDSKHLHLPPRPPPVHCAECGAKVFRPRPSSRGGYTLEDRSGRFCCVCYNRLRRRESSYKCRKCGLSQSRGVWLWIDGGYVCFDCWRDDERAKGKPHMSDEELGRRIGQFIVCRHKVLFSFTSAEWAELGATVRAEFERSEKIEKEGE